MKRVFLILLIVTISLFSFAQKIELEGTYQGKNIYVQNPASGIEFYCTEKVLVNGKEVPISNTSAYEIKLDSLGFKQDDTIKVEIFHKPDCKPKIINKDGGNPKVTFEIVSIVIDSNAVIHWQTKNEIGKLPFVIEQFRWNKWVKVGEVDGKGGSGENSYSFQTIPHSDNNQFRVKQSHSASYVSSKSVDYIGPDLKIKILTNQFKIADELLLSKETMYELYDKGGNIVRKGIGNKISFKGLERGYYYLNYDNKMVDVNKFW